MKYMTIKSASIPLILGSFILNIAALRAETLAPPGPATVCGYPRVVRLLLANGADDNAKTFEGLTARGLSQRINAEFKRSLSEAQKGNDREDEGKLRRDLARHGEVLRLLEGVEER